MSKQEQNTVAEVGEYKGSPTISIHELDEEGNKKQYPFSFGKKKAKLIIKHLDEIKKFAEE